MQHEGRSSIREEYQPRQRLSQPLRVLRFGRGALIHYEFVCDVVEDAVSRQNFIKRIVQKAQAKSSQWMYFTSLATLFKLYSLRILAVQNSSRAPAMPISPQYTIDSYSLATSRRWHIRKALSSDYVTIYIIYTHVEDSDCF